MIKIVTLIVWTNKAFIRIIKKIINIFRILHAILPQEYITKAFANVIK